MKNKSSVKLASKRSVNAVDWRDDEKVTKLRKRLRGFSREALEFFAEAKDTVVGVQRERVKAKPMTHRDIASRGQEKLIESIGRDKANRSRIVELQVDALDRVQVLKDALSLARRDIKGRYGPSLRKEFGAITNQHDGIEDHFSIAVKAVKEGELLLKIIDLIVNDIDKSQLSDKDFQKTAQLIWHPGRAD